MHNPASRCKLWREKEKYTGIQLGIKPGTFLLLSWTLLPLTHWSHGRGAEASLHNSYARGLSQLQPSLSLSLRWIHCLVFECKEHCNRMLKYPSCTNHTPHKIMLMLSVLVLGPTVLCLNHNIEIQRRTLKMNLPSAALLEASMVMTLAKGSIL